MNDDEKARLKAATVRQTLASDPSAVGVPEPGLYAPQYLGGSCVRVVSMIEARLSMPATATMTRIERSPSTSTLQAGCASSLTP